MVPKLREFRTDKDDLAWEQGDDQSDEWDRSLNEPDILRGIGNLISKYHSGNSVELHRGIRGGYNALYRLEYEDGSSAAMRIPCPGRPPTLLYKVSISSY